MLEVSMIFWHYRREVPPNPEAVRVPADPPLELRERDRELVVQPVVRCRGR